MQKYLLLLFLFICASCIGSKNGILEQNKTFDIIIDPDRFTDDLDLSCILTDSIEIIKLETSDECLIGEIKKVSFTDQFIFVSDPYGHFLLLIPFISFSLYRSRISLA